MADKIKLLIEITVDPAVFDLTEYTAAAVADGWGDDQENGLWYLAEEIVSEYSVRGCELAIIP